MRQQSIVAAFAAVVAFLVSPSRSHACSICGCDPASATLGVDRPGLGNLRVALEDRYLFKEAGEGVEEERERENRILLRAQYAPLQRLVLQVEVPFFAWKTHSHVAEGHEDHATGLGDVQLSARTELLRLGGLMPRHTVALTGTLKLPTGPNAHAHDGGEIEEHAQLGSGSFDGMAMLSYVYGDQPWAVYGNVAGRLNGTNSRDFRYGHALYATLGARRTLLDGRLLLALEGNWRNAGKDRFGDGTFDENSGGQLLYATATAGVALTQELLLRAMLQIPVAKDLNGVQSEHPVTYVGLAYDWAL